MGSPPIKARCSPLRQRALLFRATLRLESGWLDQSDV
jgi:hypothetical protein